MMIIVDKLFPVYICFFLPFVVFGAEISIHTPSGDYIIVQNLTKSISDRYIHFKVKTCKNAYVGLISGNNESDPLYEIVIEEGWNPDSYIRIGRNNSGPKFSEILEYLLHCNHRNSDTHFRITWNDRTINLHVFIYSPKFPYWDIILTWTSVTDLWPILNVGICTMDGSTGLWQFYTPDIPTISNETTALSESTTTGVTRPPSTITDGKLTSPLTYTSTDLLAMHDETTVLPQTTRPDNMTTTSEDLPSRITNDATVISDISSASTSTKSSTMTLKFMTTPSSMSRSKTEPCTGTCNSTCTCNCFDVQQKESNKVMGNQLKIDKKTLSSYKRKLKSAPDPRKSSLYIGCIGKVVYSVNVSVIVLLDFLPSA